MQRLKTRPQFQAVLGGAVVAKTSHFALHRVELNSAGCATTSYLLKPLFPVQETWFGAMAPKRWAKRAVTRNVIKRQIYTVSASLTQLPQPAAFLVRLRREFSRADYPSAASASLIKAVRAELLELVKSAA